MEYDTLWILTLEDQMHVGLLQQACCAPVFSGLSLYGFNKGLD
jgi:hypothetical protein